MTQRSPRFSRLLSVFLLLLAAGAIWQVSAWESAQPEGALERDVEREVSVPEEAQVLPDPNAERASATARVDLEAEQAAAPEEDTLGSAQNAAPTSLRFQVRGPHGEALAGAVVTDDPDSRARFVRSDETGAGRITFREARGGRLWATALGFTESIFDISAQDIQSSSLGTPYLLHLERDTLLTLNFRGASNLLGCAAEVSASQLFQRGKMSFPSDMQLVAGAAKPGFAHGEPGQVHVSFPLGEPAQIVLSGVVVGVPLTVKVLDQFVATIFEEELEPMQDMESRIHEVLVSGVPHDFSLRLRSESGVPLVGATVELRFSETSWRVLSTDEMGVVQVEGAWAERGDLELSHSGYVPIFRPAWRVPDGEQVEFRMTRGYTVHIRVQDREGVLADAQVIAEVSGYKDFDSDQLEDGSEEIEDLPAGTVQLSARVGGRKYSMEHDSTIPEAVLTILEHGAIKVNLPQALAKDQRLSLFQDREGFETQRVRVEGTTYTYDWIAPGTYALCIQELQEGPARIWKDVSDRISVTVTDGQEQTATVGNLWR